MLNHNSCCNQSPALLVDRQFGKSYKVVKTVYNHLDDLLNIYTKFNDIVETYVSAINSEGEAQKKAVIAEGNNQINRVIAAGDATLWQEGLGCQEQTLVLTDNIPEGTIITIPNGMKYIVGRNHLRLSWNGCVLFPGENFNEIGTVDTMSDQFSCSFNMIAGDIINIWTPALGSDIAAEALITANNAMDAVIELSNKIT